MSLNMAGVNFRYVINYPLPRVNSPMRVLLQNWQINITNNGEETAFVEFKLSSFVSIFMALSHHMGYYTRVIHSAQNHSFCKHFGIAQTRWKPNQTNSCKIKIMRTLIGKKFKENENFH